MHKVARILLDVCAIGWIAFVVIAIIMTLSSCSFESDECMYANQIENIDEVD